MELNKLGAELTSCRQCPRLVAWREQVAADKRAAFRDEEYWGRPVPGFGDPDAVVVLVGLAPAAHGANRTGRMFTGDRSGEWLYRALYRAGFANRAESVACDDGLELSHAWVTSAVKCAPPENKPSVEERDTCAVWLGRELDGLESARVYVALGQYGYLAVWRHLSSRLAMPKPRPKFRHGLEMPLDDDRHLLASFHPSQQNTFTGRLTEAMFDSVFRSARRLAGLTDDR